MTCLFLLAEVMIIYWLSFSGKANIEGEIIFQRLRSYAGLRQVLTKPAKTDHATGLRL